MANLSFRITALRGLDQWLRQSPTHPIHEILRIILEFLGSGHPDAALEVHSGIVALLAQRQLESLGFYSQIVPSTNGTWFITATHESSIRSREIDFIIQDRRGRSFRVLGFHRTGLAYKTVWTPEMDRPRSFPQLLPAGHRGSMVDLRVYLPGDLPDPARQKALFLANYQVTLPHSIENVHIEVDSDHQHCGLARALFRKMREVFPEALRLSGQIGNIETLVALTEHITRIFPANFPPIVRIRPNLLNRDVVSLLQFWHELLMKIPNINNIIPASFLRTIPLGKLSVEAGYSQNLGLVSYTSEEGFAGVTLQASR